MRSVLKLILLFIAAQVMGLLIVNAYVSNESAYLRYQGYSLEDLLFIIIGFAFAVTFLLIILNIYRGDLLFKIMELVVITAATFIAVYGLGIYVGVGYEAALAVSLAVGLAKFITPQVRNLTAVVSSVGVAVMFGMFLTFTEAVIFLIVMSVYDYVAVFVTKHMMRLAYEFGRREMSFSVATHEKVSEKVRVVTPEGKTVDKTEERVERLELGTGDISLPLAFNVVVFKTVFASNPSAAVSTFITVGTFSTLALSLVLLYVKKRRLFLPALPPILTGTLIGYILAYVSGIAGV